MTKKHYILLPSPLHESYTLRFMDGATQIGPEVNISIENENCTPVTLMWLNARGGWDSYAFNPKQEEDLAAARTYSRKQQSDLTYSQRFLEGMEAAISGSLTSEFLDSDTLDFLSSLVDSPVVYLVHLDNGAYNYLPVSVLNTSLPKKSIRLINVQIDYQLNVERLNQNSLNVQPSIPAAPGSVEWNNLWS